MSSSHREASHCLRGRKLKNMKTIKEIIQRRELLANLIVRNLKIRYKGSILGFFWSLLDPLLMMLVYLVFIKLMRFSIELPVLLVAVIAWQFFIMCTSDSVGVITGSTNLVKRTYFPRAILPLATVIANLVNFLLSILVLMVILLLFRVPLSITLAWFPIVVLFQFILCLGLSLIISCSNVFFRDTQHLIGVILMVWFFMTPILYPASRVPERFLNLYFLNPMAVIITMYRYVFLGKELPQVGTFYISFIIIAFIFIIGWIIFSRYQKYFADEL